MPKKAVKKPTMEDFVERMRGWKEADDAWILAKAEVCLLLARTRRRRATDQELEDHAVELMKLSSEQIRKNVTAALRARSVHQINLDLV